MALKVTFSFTLQYMFLSMLFGFGLALLIHKASSFNNVCRTIFFLPFTTSVTAGAIIWSYVYTDIYGTLTGLVSSSWSVLLRRASAMERIVKIGVVSIKMNRLLFSA